MPTVGKLCDSSFAVCYIPKIYNHQAYDSPAFVSIIGLAQHAYSKTEQALHLRKPLQRCTNIPNSGKRLKTCVEGVLVAKKDFNAPKHEELDVPNLHVIKALQSLNSKGFVKTQFSWQYYYYTLTPEGVEYLREWYVELLNVYISFLTIQLGYTCPPRLCPLPTRKPPVLLDLPRFALGARVFTGVLAVTEKTTAARKRMLPQTTIHSSLVLVGVVPEHEILISTCFSLSNMYNAITWNHVEGLHETTCDHYF